MPPDPFAPSPQTPSSAQAVGTSWFVVDGELQASALWGCEDELFLVAGSLESRDYRGDFTMSVWVFTADRAGVVRALDDANVLRFYIDVIEGEHILDVVVNGVRTELADTHLPLLPNTWYEIVFTQTGSLLTVHLDGLPLLTTSYSALGVGYMGVYAGTTAMFDS